MQTKISKILKFAHVQQTKSKYLLQNSLFITKTSIFSHGSHKTLNSYPNKDVIDKEETILFNNPTISLAQNPQVSQNILSGQNSQNQQNPKFLSQETVEQAINEAAPKIEEMISNLSELERECLKRFAIGAMSHGAINFQAHSMLAGGANLCALFLKIKESPEFLPKDKNYQEAFRNFMQNIDHNSYGPKSNSGEGGELSLRDCTLSQSFIRQVASGRFGVNLRYLTYARELQIKINQGAKPGVGGQLPGHKVTDEIAKARYAIPGLSLISPPPHHDIYSIEDLRQLIYDLRSVNPLAKVSVKIASLAGCGTIAVGIAKCFPQKSAKDKLDISIAGPGGTGAATLTDKHEINQPWESALAEIHQALLSENLRERVTLTISGGIQTGLDSFKAILLGADNIETGSGALVSLGCIMVRKCHEGDCPTGIATNKEDLINLKFKGKPEHVAKYLIGLAKSLGNYLKTYGFKSPREAVGRTDLLEVDDGSPLKGLEKLLTIPPHIKQNPSDFYYHPETEAGSSLLESQIIDSIGNGVTYFRPKASNAILSFGARIGYYHQTNNLLKEPITIDFKGLANGQSFGFCAPKNLVLIAENANDGTGKALSGAEIYIKGLAGNCMGYGALEGFIAAKECGDRAGIRLSYQARIMVKKLGNNAFNFMTGGYGYILGDERYYENLKGNFHAKRGNFFNEEHIVGPNLGSGFTGGVLIIPKLLDEELRKKGFISKTMLALKSSALENKDIEFLKEDLKRFNKYIPDDPLILELLSKSPKEIAGYFLKYEPKSVATAEVKPPPSKEREDNNKKTPISQNPLQFQSSEISSNSLETSIVSKDSIISNSNDETLSNENTDKNPINSSCKTDTEKSSQDLFERMLNYDKSPKKPITIPDPVNTSHEFDSCGVAMLANLKRDSSHDLVEKAISMIGKFHHRGSIGIDPKTGDGCGIMWFGYQSFFVKKFPELNLAKKKFGVIFLAFPEGYSLNESKERYLYHLAQNESIEIIGNRHVPVNNDYLGFIASQQAYYFKQYIAINVNEEESTKPRACNLELKLMRIRLRFEFELQKEKNKLIPHIFSSSSQYMIYKGLFKEKYFKEYFQDMQDPDFEASLGISHVRFATNTLPQFKNIQPLARLANNGENNNLALIERFISEDPFLKDDLGINPDLWTMSDSHILSLFIDYYFLKLYEKGSDKTAFKILRAVMHPYYPNQLPSATISHYYNLFGLPFEGPNASIAFVDQKVALYRDRNGFRPLRGLINKDMVFVGSELGPVEMEGEPFNLPPAEPVFFDMEQNKSDFGFYKETKEETEAIVNQWKSFLKPSGEIKSLKEVASQRVKKILSGNITSSELKLMKLRANWTEELHETIMKKLFKGEELLSSMADQGPIEALVFGSSLDINGMFKAKFSQVTNPPLAKREEECYMSTLTYIGKKPTFEELADDIKENNISGIVLQSPIIDNVELANILGDSRIKSAEIPIIYPLNGYEEAIKVQLNFICETAVTLVKNQNVNLIVLTDIQTTEPKDEFGVITPILVASVVDSALMKEGLRRDVSIILSASSLLIGRDIAQAISIGSVDLVNPYLPFIKDPKDSSISKEQFKKICANYKDRLKQELCGFMARMGVSSVSAYRGAKIFQAFGLDKELAALYGVRSEFGGFGLRELAQLIYSNHLAPKPKGYGKYDGVSREFIWKADTAQLAIKAARSVTNEEQKEYFTRFEHEANFLKKGNPRGWLKLKKPTIWTEHNPLPVCILGGGAAAFYHAGALLESKLPIKITMFERRHVNLFGLVGEGVAPDHPSTKKQGYILQKCLEDERIEYYGGIEVGSDISFEELRKQFPCMIDCSGASEDIKLNIPGESLPQVIPASKLYRTYNGVYDPKRKEDWPLNRKSRNPAIGIIGGGNVSADISRILLSDPQKLEETSMNPNFLNILKEQGPQIINVFIRGGPQDSKIIMKELEELENAGLWINSWFEPSKIPSQIDEKQKELVTFYAKYLNNKKPNNGLKRLCFYFEHTPASFQSVGEDVELSFSTQKTKFRLRNVITALGRKPSKTLDRKADYYGGWAAGKGGNLKSAEISSKLTAELIQKDFLSNKFQVSQFTNTPENETWHLKSPVNKQEFLNIINNVQEKKIQIRSAKDFHLAKAGSSSISGTSNIKKRRVLDMNLFKDVKADPDFLTIYNGETTYKIEPKINETLLKVLKKLQEENSHFKGATPEYECGGEGTCGTCGMDVIVANGDVKQAKKEKQLLEINGFSENSFLCCQHDCEQMKGFVLYVDKKKLGNNSNVDKKALIDVKPTVV